MLNRKLIIFTGPSGVGKATIEKELFKNKDLKLKLSVSATTRVPRKGEVHGREYFFLTPQEFNEKIINDEFVEWNEHFSHKYGTLKQNIREIQKAGYNPVLEIETEGAKNIISKFGKRVISIFISPPSMKDLIARIRKRGSESEDQLQERIARVEEESRHISLFDYIVVNDNLEHAVRQLETILKKEL